MRRVEEEIDNRFGLIANRGNAGRSLGDAHVYLHHFEAVQENIERQSRHGCLSIRERRRPFPSLVLKASKIDEDFCFKDLALEGYTPYKSIGMKVAV